MKKFFFLVYAFFFNLGAKFGLKPDRVGLVSMHNAHFTDALGEIEAELKNRVLNGGVNFEFVKVERTALNSLISAFKFMTVDAFRLGRAKYIFLNDNFMALSYTKPNKNAKIVQLWHGQGAFKKFGFDIDVPSNVRKYEILQSEKLTHVFCSSFGVKPIYANAFKVDSSKVFVTGSPSADCYFRAGEKRRAREKLFELYPKLRGKYIIMYAPTFRDDKTADAALLSNFNAERIRKKINEASNGEKEAEIIVRLHPQIHFKNAVKGAFDVTDYRSVTELCLASDMLITDYSSICMDFAIQRKPSVFYAYDLESYKGARDFYFNYEDYVPGIIAENEDELIKAIKISRTEVSPRLENFISFNFDVPRGNAAARVLDIVTD